MSVRSRWHRAASWTGERFSIILFCFACLLVVLGYGVIIGQYEVFPYRLIADAYRTAKSLRESWARDARSDFTYTEIPADDVAKHWVMPQSAVDDDASFLFTGGRHRYLQFCPEFGCVAVILGRDGHLIHAYPYRPYELAEKRIVEMPFEQNFFDAAETINGYGIEPLPNGDLIAVFGFENAFPYGGGIARLDKDGHVLWYRQDYSNHWPGITAEGDILAISYELEYSTIRYSVAGKANRSIGCPGGFYKDVIRVLDPNGAVKDEISVFDALIKSPYRSHLVLRASIDSPDAQLCDPLHVNSVIPVGPALGSKLSGVSSDDLLISVRNISAVIIVGRNDHQIKYLFKGTFLSQHSAKPLPDGRIVLFDNLGASEEAGPSRVLVFDPVTKQETTFFPNAATPKHYETFSDILGAIELSRDGANLLVAFGVNGQGYEIRLSDGAILTTFDNVHDLRPVSPGEERAEMAARIDQFGIYYVYPDLLSNF